MDGQRSERFSRLVYTAMASATVVGGLVILLRFGHIIPWAHSVLSPTRELAFLNPGARWVLFGALALGAFFGVRRTRSWARLDRVALLLVAGLVLQLYGVGLLLDLDPERNSESVPLAWLWEAVLTVLPVMLPPVVVFLAGLAIGRTIHEPTLRRLSLCAVVLLCAALAMNASLWVFRVVLD